jgi:carboxypeptidase Q
VSVSPEGSGTRAPGRRLLPALLACSLAFALPAVAESSERPAARDGVEALIARLQRPTPLAGDLQVLSDSIGGRPTGSAALDRAVAWAIGRLRDAGLEDVGGEVYTVPLAWMPGEEHGEIVEPALSPDTESPLPIPVAAMPFSAPTPASGTVAEVVDAGAGREQDFAAAGTRLRGRWVMIHNPLEETLEELTEATVQLSGSPTPVEPLVEEFSEPHGLVAHVEAAGAAGILVQSARPRDLVYRHTLSLEDRMVSFPAAIVGREAAGRISRLLSRGGTVRFRLVARPQVLRNVAARNVVASVRGRELPQQEVVLGAHLDSWDLGTGAEDNGCNVALVIDLARQMMALARAGLRPRRTVRFVLYTGEELGLLGSQADVRRHRGGLDRIAAFVTVDMGSGSITGFSLGGRADMRTVVTEALAPVRGLGPFTETTDAFVATDNYDYLVEGVPNLVANQDPEPYLADNHAASDTFDKVDLQTLEHNAAVVAALVWGLADADQPLPARQNRSEVETLLHATGLEEQMRACDLWGPFASGERGRARQSPGDP